MTQERSRAHQLVGDITPALSDSSADPDADDVEWGGRVGDDEYAAGSTQAATQATAGTSES